MLITQGRTKLSLENYTFGFRPNQVSYRTRDIALKYSNCVEMITRLEIPVLCKIIPLVTLCDPLASAKTELIHEN